MTLRVSIFLVFQNQMSHTQNIMMQESKCQVLTDPLLLMQIWILLEGKQLSGRPRAASVVRILEDTPDRRINAS